MTVPARQHQPGIRIVRAHAAKLRGVDAHAAIQDDFGPARRGELLYIVDLDSFYQTFEPALEADGNRLRFGPDKPPQPAIVAAWLLNGDEEYKRLVEMERRLGFAPARDIKRAQAALVRALPAPKAKPG